ncbi:hypothetical protein MUY14_14210 [Amycolatopsis sp. FBCC-B4732]|nr:hypothetical protein [Amycolatopsis sp. FBCC-B4732]UOX91721.1 hypothetical protein MUY14_14210 [Amycolatopsis sp. FBCC-B4732]
MVDLEHPETSGDGPIRERIVTGAQNRILVYTGMGELLFGEPSAAHRLGAGTAEDRVSAVEPVVRQEFLRVLAEQRSGEGAREDVGFGVVEQMCRPRGSRGEGGAARITGKLGVGHAVTVPI